jgi:hypothetical protein
MILALCSMCFVKFLQLDNLRNQRNLLSEKNKSITELANSITESSFRSLKSKKKIFYQGMDVKNFIKKIVKNFSLRKVLFKMDNCASAHEKILEIKFNSPNESRIYKIFDALWREFDGIVGFESIKILRSNLSGLFVEVKCKFFLFDEKEAKNSIELIEDKHRCKTKSIDLFNLRGAKEHNLLGIIDDSRAYIDDAWYCIGDKIDDWEVANIRQNSIKIQSNNRKLTLKLGSSW